MKTPRSREAIQAMLAARGLNPIHRWGQNFLVQKDMLGRIADAAAPAAGELVLEPGPGPGGLTEELLDRGARVLSVEIDAGLSAHLREVLGDRAGFRLIECDILGRKSAIAPEVLDALDPLPATGPPPSWSVVSNLPYQISSPFISALVPLPNPPRQIVVMLQAEVGKVLLATPGDEDYSALSFLARVYLDVARLFAVPPSAFWPVPQVRSVVLRLTPQPHPVLPPAVLLPVVRRLFQTRRKKLSRTLEAALQTIHGAPAAERVGAALQAEEVDLALRIDGVDPAAVARVVARCLQSPS